MQKFKNIEFLRVIGCLAIILFHLFLSCGLFSSYPDIEFYKEAAKVVKNGQMAIDLFFILSGFFFALKLDTTKSIFSFLKSKLIRLYPVFIFVLFLNFIISQFNILDFSGYDNFLALLGLNGTSLVFNLVPDTVVFWYVSAMLWVLMFYFYILKNYEKKNVNLFIAILVFFCYSFLIHAKGGKINNHVQTYYFVFNVGMMRALAGIGVGYLIAEWYKLNIDTIKVYTPTIIEKFAISLIEILCVFFVVNNLIFHQPSFNNYIIYIIMFASTTILFLIKKGIISQWLENEFWVKISRYTYSLYMTHFLVFSILKRTVWEMSSAWIYAHPLWIVFISFVSIIPLGLFTYYFIEIPAKKYFIKNKG